MVPKGEMVGRVLINRGMSRVSGDRDGCLEGIVSPAQREVFLIIDEWWKKYGFSPSLRDIAYVRGKMGLGNTKELVDRLVRLGVVKRVEGRGRTVRPVYINFRNLE